MPCAAWRKSLIPWVVIKNVRGAEVSTLAKDPSASLLYPLCAAACHSKTGLWFLLVFVSACIGDRRRRVLFFSRFERLQAAFELAQSIEDSGAARLSFRRRRVMFASYLWAWLC